MGSLGTTQFIFLLAVVASTAALCGFVASMLVRRKKQRARRSFIVGFLFGFTAGVVVRRRWREIGHLAVRALNSAAAPSRLDRSPPQLRRLPLALLTVRR
jgi:hypothetical protein